MSMKTNPKPPTAKELQEAERDRWGMFLQAACFAYQGRLIAQAGAPPAMLAKQAFDDAEVLMAELALRLQRAEEADA